MRALYLVGNTSSPQFISTNTHPNLPSRFKLHVIIHKRNWVISLLQYTSFMDCIGLSMIFE